MSGTWSFMAMARTSKATQQHNIAILNSALFCSAFTNQVMYIISYEHRESVSSKLCICVFQHKVQLVFATSTYN